MRNGAEWFGPHNNRSRNRGRNMGRNRPKGKDEMSIINDAILGNMFDDKDTNRYGGGSGASKDNYLTEGPGAYCLELSEYKTGVGESEKRFGQPYIAMIFTVVSAQDIKDRDGNAHAPTWNPGDSVTVVKFLSGRISTKEALEATAAIVGTPPAIQVPDGAHEGKVLPMVNNAVVEACSEDDGARVAGTQVWANVVPNTKTKGKYAGQTFFNAYFSPATEDGKQGRFPDWDALVAAGVDMDAQVVARFGTR